MNRFLAVLFLMFVSVGSLISAPPAMAQASRTWVSGVGDDANPCSRTAPCKTFAGAISKTAAKGEINCLDPAGFGAVTITKSIAIVCTNTLGGILSAGTNGIIVNAAATDVIALEGIKINGFGTGLNGFRILSASSVYIRNCTVRGVTQNAVDVNGPNGARVFIDSSEFVFNNAGVNLNGVSGANNTALLRNVVIDKNTNFALSVAAGSTAVISDTVLAGSTASIIAGPGSSVISYGNNIIRGTGLPTSTITLQ